MSMAMNREQRRYLQRSGDLDAEGQPVRTRTAPPKAAPAEERASAGEFVRDVRGELRKVAWPTREETVNYTSVVLVTLVIITVVIFGLDWVFTKGTEALFHP
jgi:preprotein translocase subunit SecE